MAKYLTFLISLITSLSFQTCEEPIKTNEPPVCLIKNPQNNEDLIDGDQVTVSAYAVDNDGVIETVYFYIDGIKMLTAYSLPYSYIWDTSDDTVGLHTISVTAEDDDGEKTEDTVYVNLLKKNTAPRAMFVILSISQTTETTFHFDASGSSDDEDVCKDLQVRWDWENDSIWDTDFSTTKIAAHQFHNAGTYMVTLQVMDTESLTNTANKQVVVEHQNSAPTASFTYSPKQGTRLTTFSFDASECIDDEDESKDLQVRWDWENDGIWDTDFSSVKTITHKYNRRGKYTVLFQVKDSKGLIDTLVTDISVAGIDSGTVTDIDGNVYKTVKIGNQWWMAENLKVIHYRNGNSIQKVTDTEMWGDPRTWGNLTTGAYCYYDNDDANADIYGALYNWFAVNDSRMLAPKGWHIPTDDEWKELEIYIGMNQTTADYIGFRGTDVGNRLRSTSGWSYNGNGTDDYCFAALPGGSRNYGGNFYNKTNAFFWTATKVSSSGAWTRTLYSYYSGIGRWDLEKTSGLSVRCVKD